MRGQKQGLLKSLHRIEKEERSEGVLQVQGSGDYLAFLDEGDPVYLPRDVLDWFRERQQAESFVKRLMHSFKKKI